MTLPNLPVLLRGLFKLRAPFKTTPNTIYTIEAARTFDEIEVANEDVMALVYTPVGLTEKEYQADKAALTTIYTLLSDDEPPIYVPGTYIEEYPDDSGIRYEHVILCASLGALPNTLKNELTQLMNEIGELCSDLTGAEEVKVELATAPTSSAITVEQHRVAEQNRMARIKRRETSHAENIRLRQRIAEQDAYIADLEKRIT